MPRSYEIPITVGVVGHLDVITSEEHRARIEKLFIDLASAYPASPIYLFTSIAEGADRFVANIFLGLKKANENYKDRFEMIVPTPFPAKEYEKDFSGESKKEFYELLGQAKRAFCIGSCEYSSDRPSQYLRAGKFVADSSVILLALWDGEKGKRGGTADVVRHKIAGDDENVADSTFEYDGTVFIVPCRRTSTSSDRKIASENAEPLSLEMILKDSAIKDALDKIEEINSAYDAAMNPSFENSRRQLFNKPEKLDEPLEVLSKWYSLFDVNSLGYRSGDLKISMWLFAFGLFFIVALEVYSNLILSDLAFGVVMLMIISATLIYFYSRTTKYHYKYLFNRTLAEALRIQFYWNIAGINKNVSDFFLRIHRKDFTWVKYIISAIYGSTYNNRTITPEKVEDLTENWVKDQARFFKSSVDKMTKKLAFYNRISNAAFVTIFGLLLSIPVFRQFYAAHDLLNYLFVVIGAFLGIFALIKAYIQMKGYQQLMNQYELMDVIYNRAESKIIETETYDLSPEERLDYLKELFFVIGKEALIENGNWYLIFKEKEPEIEGI
jgi:hypothetical protein